jgi:hypothetical protein
MKLYLITFSHRDRFPIVLNGPDECDLEELRRQHFRSGSEKLFWEALIASGEFSKAEYQDFDYDYSVEKERRDEQVKHCAPNWEAFISQFKKLAKGVKREDIYPADDPGIMAFGWLITKPDGSGHWIGIQMPKCKDMPAGLRSIDRNKLTTVLHSMSQEEGGEESCLNS